MTTTRTINKQKYNVRELVEKAISDAYVTERNLESARKSLSYLGNANPDDETVTRYAREYSILRELQCETGANFTGQIGKISFSDLETTIANVEAYLNRRNAGRRSRWGK